MAQALANSGLSGGEWLARKEVKQDKPSLHLYIELDREPAPWGLASMRHLELKRIDPFYRNLETMMGIKPLEVTLLRPGTFGDYYREKMEAGTELAKRKPPRMNASDDVIEKVMCLSAQQSGKYEVALKER